MNDGEKYLKALRKKYKKGMISYEAYINELRGTYEPEEDDEE